MMIFYSILEHQLKNSKEKNMAQIFSKRTYSHDKEADRKLPEKDSCEKRRNGDQYMAEATPSEAE